MLYSLLTGQPSSVACLYKQSAAPKIETLCCFVKFILRFYLNGVAYSVETRDHVFTRSCRHGQMTSIHDGPWTRSEGKVLDARVAAGQRATGSKAWTTRTQKALCLQADLSSRALNCSSTHEDLLYSHPWCRPDTGASYKASFPSHHPQPTPSLTLPSRYGSDIVTDRSIYILPLFFCVNARNATRIDLLVLSCDIILQQLGIFDYSLYMQVLNPWGIWGI
jgi:hypothetical protein